MAENEMDFFETFILFVNKIAGSFYKDWLFTSMDKIDAPESKTEMLEKLNKFEPVCDFESHNYFEMCLCINGTLAVELEHAVYQLNEGEILLIFPDHVHREYPLKGGSHEAIWIVSNLDIISILLTGKKSEDSNFFVKWGCSLPKTGDNNVISNCFRQINSEFAGKRVNRQEFTKAVMLQILILVLRNTGNIIQKKYSKENWRESIVDELKAYIERNYSQNIKLPEISHQLCISPNYLNTIFKSATGRTIMRYVEETRIFKARWFLQETTHSIECISSMLGYCDQYHFSKCFKKETGYTPSAYRKKI